MERNDVYFVFPSEIAASVWAKKALELTGKESLALARFTAWDRFKETSVRARMQTKVPVSAVLRRLFTEKLLQRNAIAVQSAPQTAVLSQSIQSMEYPLPSAEPGLPFTALIPPEFACEGGLFAGWTAAVLPSLALWKKKREHSTVPADAEDRDFAALEKEYSQFLEQNGLFEPAWEKPPLSDREHTWYIFFPEAIEDFVEYEAVLASAPNIILVRDTGYGRDSIEAPLNAAPDTAQFRLRRYRSTREEIKAAAAEIIRIHTGYGIPWQEIAVSVPALAEAEPYILREFRLKNIPVQYRSGKVLSGYSAGSLFTLFKNCVSGNFSFTSIKALLLNNQFPWKFPSLNEELIRFGIKNNCVTSYREKGKPVDIWEAAFKMEGKEERLFTYYSRLKKSINAIAASKSFAEIRNRYFAFRSRDEFFDETLFTPEADAVLGRCIEELSALILLEQDYPALIPADPFSFYLSVLKEKVYVPQSRTSGVSIFPWRVAAATPFAFHIILNASQSAASVLYQPLLFLRQDKRLSLGIADSNASDTFFRLYSLPPANPDSPLAAAGEPHVHISCADQTFSGYTVPHGFFLNNTEPYPEAAQDAFDKERKWYSSAPENGNFPPLLFSVQKQGFGKWAALLDAVLCPPTSGKDGAQTPVQRIPFSLLHASFSHSEAGEETKAGQLLKQKLAERQFIIEESSQKKLLKVSATDMTEFFCCPVYWLYRKILAVSDISLEAGLLDDASMGNLYHEILKNLFERIKDEDRVFVPGKIQTYKDWARFYTADAAHRYPAFQGPLAEPLIESQAESISEKIGGLLETEAILFADFAVGPLEQWFSFEENGIRFNGKIDRISFTPDGTGAVIIDYKTGPTPLRAACCETEDTSLSDFQMPMYIKLFEHSVSNNPVYASLFMSIIKNDVTMITGTIKNTKTNRDKKGCSREEYQITMDAFDIYLDKFREAIEKLDFVPGAGIFPAHCRECEYKNICRTTFSLSGQSIGSSR